MKVMLRTAAMLVGLLAILVGFADRSEARSASAFMGQAQSFADGSSFYNTRGVVLNGGATTKQFCAALPVDSAGHTVVVSVRAPDLNHEISCAAGTVDANGNTTGGGNWYQPSQTGVNISVTLDSLSVPTGGGLNVCCNMSPTSAWNTTSW